MKGKKKRPSDACLRAALELARKAIASGHESWICYALAKVSSDNYDLRDACKYLEDYVMAQLFPHITLGGWLSTRGIPLTWEVCRNARLAWIDWMLEGLK